MISVRNLSYRYPNGARDILSGLSLEFADASFTAIMGANGSGKSTLAKCLNGLLQPTNGDVAVDGMNTKQGEFLPAIRRKVGFVFQDPNMQMTSATIERELAFGLQNVGAPADEIHHAVERELASLGFAERRLSSPSTLSGGERQRLALATALILEPRYLILDEPTSFLSSSSRRNFMKSILRVREEKQTAIILITQFLDEAMHADRIIVFHEAQVTFDNTPHLAATHYAQFSTWGIFVPPHLVAHE